MCRWKPFGTFAQLGTMLFSEVISNSQVIESFPLMPTPGFLLLALFRAKRSRELEGTLQGTSSTVH